MSESPLTSEGSRRETKRVEGQEMHFSHLITVFAVSTGMVGVCLTALGIIQLVAHTAKVQTRSAELLVVNSAILLISALTSFIAMRLRFRGPWRLFAVVADVCLVLGIFTVALGALLLAMDFGRM